jgi:3-deoxy-manno-octulosonate cytidylyltransferase (CMP-KDO synthetase)
VKSNYKVIIPARYTSTRLPGKSLLDIGGKTLLQHVYDAACKSKAEQVLIATEDQRIADAAKSFGADVVMTSSQHASGTDRIAEVVEMLGIPDNECVVNLQGDEVAMPPELIDQVAKLLIFSDGCNMATLCEPMLSEHDIDDKNIVKVVFNMNKSALYFSRIPIPYHKVDSDKEYYRHIGIYAYRAGFLKLFSGWAASELEKRESLEQLRALDHGQQILIEKACAVSGIGVDTKGDLERARQLIKNNN